MNLSILHLSIPFHSLIMVTKYTLTNSIACSSFPLNESIKLQILSFISSLMEKKQFLDQKNILNKKCKAIFTCIIALSHIHIQ